MASDNNPSSPTQDTDQQSRRLCGWSLGRMGDVFDSVDLPFAALPRWNVREIAEVAIPRCRAASASGPEGGVPAVVPSGLVRAMILPRPSEW